MTRRLILGLVILGWTTMAAALDLGQHCWSTNFPDRIQAWVLESTGAPGVYALPTASLEAEPFYRLSGVGTGSPPAADPEGTETVNMFLGNDHEVAFTGAPLCLLELKLRTVDWSGLFRIRCPQPTGQPFEVAGGVTYQGACNAGSLSGSRNDSPRAELRTEPVMPLPAGCAQVVDGQCVRGD